MNYFIELATEFELAHWQRLNIFYKNRKETKMNTFTNYKAVHIQDFWWVTADSENKKGIKIIKIPHWIRHPKAVAVATADSLNRNTKLQLVDLI